VTDLFRKHPCISLAKVEVMFDQSPMVGMSLRGVILSSAGGVVGAERRLGRMVPSHCAADKTSCVSTCVLPKFVQQILKEPHASVVESRSALSVACSYLSANSRDSLAQQRSLPLRPSLTQVAELCKQ
jgi:hypothetical protein